MQKKPLAGPVEIRLVRFLDSMTMAGDLAVRQNGMGQPLTHLRKRVHFLNENIAMTILISHGANFADSFAESNSEISVANPKGASQFWLLWKLHLINTLL